VLHINAKKKLLRPKPKRTNLKPKLPKFKLMKEVPPHLLPYNMYSTVYMPW
jgi:hypothetical protein